MSAEHESTEDRPLDPGLYLVATPIGNLEDITLRALRVLRTVDRIACEDTRQTQKLLNHFNIQTPTVSYHMHNEGPRADELVTELKQGGRIAVVSDAGTPGIADRGAQIAAAAIAAGIAVFPIPGANAAISGLVASGLSGGSIHLPRISSRKSRPEEDRRLEGPYPRRRAVQIFYEAPHRSSTPSRMSRPFSEARNTSSSRANSRSCMKSFCADQSAKSRRNSLRGPSVRGEMVLMMKLGPLSRRCRRN